LTDLGLTDGTTRQIVEPLIDLPETPATNRSQQ
jgi:adenine deaminase